MKPAPLLPLGFWLAPAGPDTPTEPLLDRLRRAIQAEALRQGGAGAEPLRWAVTRVDPARGLWLEGVAVLPSADREPGS